MNPEADYTPNDMEPPELNNRTDYARRIGEINEKYGDANEDEIIAERAMLDDEYNNDAKL